MRDAVTRNLAAIAVAAHATTLLVLVACGTSDAEAKRQQRLYAHRQEKKEVAKTVRATWDAKAVAGCRSLGLVSGEDGKFFSPEEEIKIAAAEKGGNVVLIGESHPVPRNDNANDEIDGEAFLCPDGAH